MFLILNFQMYITIMLRLHKDIKIMKKRMIYLEENRKICFTDSCKSNLENLVLEINIVQSLVIKYNL